MRTVVGLYNRFEDAQQVIQKLNEAGFDSKKINLIANDANGKLKNQSGATGTEGKQDLRNGTAAGAAIGGIGGLLVGLGALAIPGIGPVLAAGPIAAALAGAGIGAAGGALVGALVDLGIPEDQSHQFAEGVRRGGTLVTAQVDENRVQEAVNIMNQYNPVDINQRSQNWQKENWKRFDETSQPMTDDQLNTERQRYEQESIPTTGHDATLPVIEEDVQIGKQEVERGRVRIHSFETQIPVEKDVNLRKEHVDVERQKVDRPATDADFDAFKDRTIEVNETEEIPTVNKTSRVVEEVHVNKDVTEQKETIHDTARRTDVEVERMGQDWNANQSTFQNHYRTNFASSGHDFTYYQPAYRYGYELRNNPQYQNADWGQIEPRVRRDWESSGQRGRWEDFRDAIRYGFTGK